MDTVFFIASKLVWMVADPKMWPVYLIGLGVVMGLFGKHRAAFRFNALAFVFLMAVCFLPIDRMVLGPLEGRFPSNPAIETAPEGIILLSGSERPLLTARSGVVNVNGAADRILATIDLANRFPQARIVLVGGSGRLEGLPEGMSEAGISNRVLLSAGIDPARITIEQSSRNTAESAVTTRALISGDQAGAWVLVTSAWHMPRSVAVFCTAGWRDLLPYPTDHSSIEAGRSNFNIFGNLDEIAKGVREWIGLMAYRVTGRSDSLLSDGC